MTQPSVDPQNSPLTSPLYSVILTQVDAVLRRAEEASLPLEVDPARSDLFELFVTAHGAGYLEEDAEHDLTADELCKQLASRWGLDQAAQTSVANQEKLDAQNLAKMRLLWSLLRMWMEWTYAWSRWTEFQPEANKV
ncbi:hypothetical protein [Rubinisphaera sp.]|uniref:hypothetical protein n=1 Tax=Rubinisphaera sp. TaxID=2024857 RepID=UPI000C11FCD2|nr:hypothetical protein [Rubinisphaera sp.]MBV12010.1 hypothetical protein [Rubinisphaera sp.]|tara:strand:- start:11032 stop:11442 length:411 start_codon:yes stop_codon:yes gene_type:complete